VTFPEYPLPITGSTLGQLTNHSTFHFSEGGASSKKEIDGTFEPHWGERGCNNVNYVKK